MIRLGAMASSWVGERLGMSPHRLKILVACGAAAGLAAAYNIPVGGALFAMEVILGNFALEIFGPIVVASVISTLIARATLGNMAVYSAPELILVSGWELVAYLGLGIVGALASIAFVFGTRALKVGFSRLSFLPLALHPVLGMGLLGALALLVPHVLGSGLDTIQLAVHDGIDWRWLLVLPLAKILATGLTVGSGGAGGMFTPSLFVGATVGGAYGYGIHALFPEATATAGAYAVVGMAAIAAGASHAPISAILILFEFTGSYELILPLMIASITASFLSRSIYPYSVYEASLRKQGIDLQWRMEEAVLAGLEASTLVREDRDLLRRGDDYATVVERFLATHRNRLFVVDDERRLLGAVSLHDIKHVLHEPVPPTAVLAHDLLVPAGRVIRPDTRLHLVAEAFAGSRYERLPVVENDGTLVGVLAKQDLLAIYSQEVLGRSAMLATYKSSDERRSFVELPPDFGLRLVPVPERLVGRTLAEAGLPQSLGIRVLEVRRDGDAFLPDAETRMIVGDALVVLGPEASILQLEGGAEEEPPAAAAEPGGDARP
jgi:CIC family chloride channel protein